jgi:murein tripeptide amidase MpaA
MKDADTMKTFDENQMYQAMGIGTVGGVYMTPAELDKLMLSLDDQFPEAVRKFSIGKSSQNRDINAYLIGIGLESKDVTMTKPGVLMIGAHHAREASSVSMCVYTVLRLLYGYVKGHDDATYLLSNTALVVVPVLNIDGYKSIADHFAATG